MAEESLEDALAAVGEAAELEEAAPEGVEGMEDLAPEELEQMEDELAGEGASPGPEEEEGGASPPDDEDEESAAEDGEQVDAHLKDSVEGSLRLKRLLSRDEDEPSGKKSKLQDPDREAKMELVKELSNKWGLGVDAVIKHVLETCQLTELQELKKCNYAPDKFNAYKSPAELLARYTQEMKERKMQGGGGTDVIAAFKYKHKLLPVQDQLLRKLSHKELRYVFLNFDGSKPLDEIVKEAKGHEMEDDNTTENSVPNGAGLSTIGRFHRLELIDPLADCAIFGDANLTFALRLCKHRKALGHVGRVICTTFEDLDTLRERYKEIDESIKELEDMHGEVWHSVDCTRIALDSRFKGLEGTLGAAYYNFPHSGAIQGFFDGHPLVNWRHENLMRLFFRALRSFMKPGGIVKVSSNMGAVGVRYSYIVGSAIENEFIHSETVPFLEWQLHRYGRSYGDKRDVYKRPDAKNNQSYNAQNAERDMVYCFSYAPSGHSLPPQNVRLPPTLKTLKSCEDGPFKSLRGNAKDHLAKQLHKRFVTEVSGTHVG